MEKTLRTSLKEIPPLEFRIDIEFNKNWLESASIIERLKAKSFLEIKELLHQKIATLSLEDLKFEIK